jgi:hypothetical protein
VDNQTQPFMNLNLKCMDIDTLYDQKLQLEMYEREILEIGDSIALSY